MDSSFSRYSPGFYYFSVLTLIRPFFCNRRDNFKYSHGFFLFPVLFRILLFFGTHIDSTLLRYSSGPFFDTRMYSNFSPYLPGFYHFLELTLIRPFFCNRRDSFIDTRTDSTFSRYSPGFYYFSVLTLIRPFSGTRQDNFSILAWILPFPGTQPDFIISRHSH